MPRVAARTPAERRILARQFQTGLACESTSSMGRSFDAMSSLAGVGHRVDYEAEAAMRFEELAWDAISRGTVSRGFVTRGFLTREVVSCGYFRSDEGRAYAFTLHDSADGGPAQTDPGPGCGRRGADVLAGVDADLIAARFHLAVVDLVTRLATALRPRTGLSTVALSGGVF